MAALLRHWQRIAITLLPVLVALVYASGALPLPLVDRLDHFIYDARLRAGMPRTLDTRIVIVDIDDASLQQLGQWPWSRDKLAQLTVELTVRQQVAALGFDVLFAEPDESSGLVALQRLANQALFAEPGPAAELQRLLPSLDHDAAFARALAGQRVVLGYYLTQLAEPRAKGVLPAPVLPAAAFPSGRTYASRWNGFGANLGVLARAAPAGGFFNAVIDADGDGVVRATPLLGLYDGGAAPSGYYESLGLAVYRMAVASPSPSVAPVFAAHAPGGAVDSPPLEALVLGAGAGRLRVPVDSLASALVPYRGPGGARGGSFRYVSAADVLAGRLAEGELRGRIVLVGATAPGLLDLRATPVSATFPGVEVHANLISGLLDRQLLSVPDYAPGYNAVQLLIAGVVLALGLPMLSAPRAVLLALATVGALVGFNAWLYLGAGLVLPLAAALVMSASAFALNMSWGYLVEARGRRELAQLFGTYVPPELVDKMLEHPDRYSMRAESRELTVMFCDMRGFTQLSEQMAPVELQALLNAVFSRLTEIIRAHQGTVDKYMGDCVMAFWGAPVELPDHAARAARAAVAMVDAVRQINAAHRLSGQPAINVGIGLNTGLMSVGDMGSAVRRSYTVVGDAVNLASRLEGLSSHYGVEIVASEFTQKRAPTYVWQELDRVRVKGRAQVVAIFTPLAPVDQLEAARRNEVALWSDALAAYRRQDWSTCETMLNALHQDNPDKVLYGLYMQRLALMASRPADPGWDGATRFDTK